MEGQEPILSHVSVPDSCCIKVTPGCGRDIPHTLADRPLNETIYVKVSGDMNRTALPGIEYCYNLVALASRRAAYPEESIDS